MWVLSLLGRSPKNGAELMNAIEDMSQGWWRPSPGSIYPLLESMQAEGLINKLPDGRYELTEKSKKEIEWAPWGSRSRPEGVDSVLNDLGGLVSYLEDVSKSDPAKVSAQSEKIRELTERLTRVVRQGGESA
jgi:DNA-binding PadR family transcriptional regulator